MQPLLFFKEQTLLSLQLIFSQIPILFLSITMKNIFIIRFTWIVQRKMCF